MNQKIVDCFRELLTLVITNFPIHMKNIFFKRRSIQKVNIHHQINSTVIKYKITCLQNKFVNTCDCQMNQKWEIVSPCLEKLPESQISFREKDSCKLQGRTFLNQIKSLHLIHTIVLDGHCTSSVYAHKYTYAEYVVQYTVVK